MNETKGNDSKQKTTGKPHTGNAMGSSSKKRRSDEWVLSTPPPKGYEIHVDESDGISISGRFKYRRSNRRCEGCDGPLYDAWIDGDWHEPGTLCTRCLSRIEASSWVRQKAKENAERSTLNQSARFENFVTELEHQQVGLKKAQEFAAQVSVGRPSAIVFFSYGKTPTQSGYGVGKTHLASSIGYELREQGWIVQTWLAADLFSELRASYADDAEMQEYAILRPAKAAELVILDDVGKENAREAWRHDIYFRLIDARYRNGPLVMTTNLTPTDELPSHIGEAAYSRLWEMTGSRWWVDMCGPDWRIEGTKKK